MEWRIVVHCKNPGCSYTILLSFSIPLEKTEVQPPLPMEIFPLHVVCRECRHWYVYSALDAEWGGYPTPPQLMVHDGPIYWTVEITCGVPGCDSLTRWQIRDDQGKLAADVANLVLTATPMIVCQQGHSLLGEESKIRIIHRD
jgi:hypothetical protein